MNVTFNPAGDRISMDAMIKLVSRSDAHGLEWVNRDTLVFTLGYGNDELLITACRMNNRSYQVRADRKHRMTAK